MDTGEKEQRRAIEKAWADEATKKLSERERRLLMRGWAAGFFDAEGHASERPDGSFTCSIDQASKDFYNLERFRDAVGVGRVVDLAPRKKKKQQPASRWAISNRMELAQLIDAIGPFLTKTKRDQLAAAFTSAKNPLEDGATRMVEVAPAKGNGKAR